MIDKISKSYLDNVQTHANPPKDPSATTRYYKLPYIGDYASVVQSKVRELIKTYCSNVDVKLVFMSFKVRNVFVNKDIIPQSLKSRVVYKFTCASCKACYIGETHRHLATRIHEHLFTDKNSHIYKHLNKSATCKGKCDHNSFTIIDSAPTKLQLKIKESLYISWQNPNLNKQRECPSFTLFN